MKYINRLIDKELEKWMISDNHKPILLRGARQTGKSSAVRNLAKKFDFFLEITSLENFAVYDKIYVVPLYTIGKK